MQPHVSIAHIEISGANAPPTSTNYRCGKTMRKHRNTAVSVAPTKSWISLDLQKQNKTIPKANSNNNNNKLLLLLLLLPLPLLLLLRRRLLLYYGYDYDGYTIRHVTTTTTKTTNATTTNDHDDNHNLDHDAYSTYQPRCMCQRKPAPCGLSRSIPFFMFNHPSDSR